MTEQYCKSEQDLRNKRLELLLALRDAERRTSDTIAVPDSKLPPDTVILMGMIQAITWALTEDPRNEASWIHDSNAPRATEFVAGRHRLKTERQIRQKRDRLLQGLSGVQSQNSGVILTPEGRSTADERALMGMVEAFTWMLNEHPQEEGHWQHDIAKPVEDYTFDDWVGLTPTRKDIDEADDYLDRLVHEVKRGN